MQCSTEKVNLDVSVMEWASFISILHCLTLTYKKSCRLVMSCDQHVNHGLVSFYLNDKWPKEITLACIFSLVVLQVKNIFTMCL